MALWVHLAVVAALASGSGSILESLGVRRAGAYGGTSLDLVALRRQWVYFAGLGVDVLGFVFVAAALHRLPLFLVQSALAFSVGVTATIAAFMGMRLAATGPDGVGSCWAWRSPWRRSPTTAPDSAAAGRPRCSHSAPVWAFCRRHLRANTGHPGLGMSAHPG